MPFPSVGIRSCALFALGLLSASALALTPAASAAKGGKGGASGGSTGSGLSLVSDSVWNSPNVLAPTWCMNEDDVHLRSWSGSLSGSFTASERLCDDSFDYSGGIWWNAGGVGIQSDVYVTGTLSDLTITAPDGTSHRAVLVGSSTSKGATTDHYQVCYVPAYSVTSNVGGRPLPGGTWQVALSANSSKVTFGLRAHMTDVNFQQQYCPESSQNLVG
jgi:hypothetical protein